MKPQGISPNEHLSAILIKVVKILTNRVKVQEVQIPIDHVQGDKPMIKLGTYVSRVTKNTTRMPNIVSKGLEVSHDIEIVTKQKQFATKRLPKDPDPEPGKWMLNWQKR